MNAVNQNVHAAYHKVIATTIQPTFEIDYVRVYQAVNRIETCTWLFYKGETDKIMFIEGHAQRYMAEGDKAPLQPVKKGGEVCADEQ
jgi:hypothetical protein